MDKKFFTRIVGGIFLLAIFFLPQNVFAEKSDWSDKDYNFKAVKKVFLTGVESDVNLSDKGNVFKQRLISDYVSSAKKLKCEVVTEGNSQDADLRVVCRIKNWADSYYIEPEHTVWEEKRRTRKKKNSNGEWAEETYYVTVPVTYPPRRVDVSDISVSFEVYDTRTGKMVFGRDDVRNRKDARAQQGMFGRICNSFFEDLGKKIKR